MDDVQSAPAVSGNREAAGPLGVVARRAALGGRIFVALLTGAVFVVACAAAPRPVVTVEEIGPGEVAQTVSAPARVDAAARQEVTAGSSGTVVAIDVEDGDRVTAGQIVVRLEAPQPADPAAPAAQLTVEAPFAGTVSIAQASGGGGAASLPSQLGGPAGGLPASTGTGPLRVGSQVSPGQPLFTVYDLSQLYVIASIDEIDIPQIREGQDAMVRIDAIEDGAFLGVVERIAIESSLTEAGGTGFPVRIRIAGPAPDQQTPPDLDIIRVGMTSSVQIIIRTQASDLVVPSRALVTRDAETVAFVVRDGVAQEVPVEVELLGEDSAAVAGELRAGDAIVVAGAEDLRDGQPVTVQ